MTLATISMHNFDELAQRQSRPRQVNVKVSDDRFD